MPIQKKPGKLWFNLAVPLPGAELTLLANGDPDLTQNPNATWVGETDAGLTSTITHETEDEVVDDYKQPISRTVTQVNMTIKGALVIKSLDYDVLVMATSGAGTRQTVAGKEKITYGATDVVPTSAAVIFPLAGYTNRFGVFHIYQATNQASVERVISGKTRMTLPIELAGLAVPGRLSSDSVGQEFKMTA